MMDITSKLERIALVAEVANHYVDDMRVMPAAGVADTIREAMAQLESTMKDRAYILAERDRTFALMLARAEKAEAERTECCLQSLASMGQAAEAHAAQLQAEAERDQWIKHAKNAVWSDSEELKLAEAERGALRAALTVYADPCDATETSPCGYEGNMCCKTARAALNTGEPQ